MFILKVFGRVFSLNFYVKSVQFYHVQLDVLGAVCFSPIRLPLIIHPLYSICLSLKYREISALKGKREKKTPRSSSSPQVPSFIEGCGLSLSPSSLANSLLVVEWQKAQPREVSCHVIHVARARCNLLKESNLKSNSKS